MTSQRIGFRLPVAYRAFFLLIEPLSALVAAFHHHFRQGRSLELLHASSAPSEVSAGTSVVLSRLAGMYLFLAVNEALVLRSTWDLRVWRTVLLALLVADLARLYSLRPLGSAIYYDVLAWSAADWGDVPFVYAGAALRVCFLAGIGLDVSKRSRMQR
ncbi:hypothetical protein DCS_03437 [Drechmeria coniospora]|uniref:DUF7704 domain-containing protein n=1 Tax=Drechmeria coniospora TaxID=98403 RepID=A0A151GH53_DRECN|nr:hypothetical protein DCS_03437 [Drechmeria coniospora]KYK56437.1 hypothetical protein DCS_03437 [Drechmeria coniospora]